MDRFRSRFIILCDLFTLKYVYYGKLYQSCARFSTSVKMSLIKIIEKFISTWVVFCELEN